MDPEVWSRLPQEVLLDVLARLPHAYIPRLREVCKGWRELLVAKHFTDRIVSVRHSQTPFLLVCVKRFQAVMAYNPALHEWRELALHCPNFQIHSLRAAGFGLLCFKGNLGRKKGDVRLLVCNPITKRWRILPCLPPGTRTSGCVNVIVLDHEPNQFKILFTQILRGSHLNRLLVATLYDSATDSWSTHSLDTTLESIYRSVYVNGSIHCIASERVHQEPGSPKSRKQGVSFDLQRKVFSKFEAPLATESAKKFMELNGELSLVTFSTVPTFASSIQQVDQQTGTWVEVHTLPSGTALGVEGHVPLGQGWYLYFADPHRQSHSLVCYNLLNQQWFSIDESFSDLRSEGYKLYHPSLCSV